MISLLIVNYRSAALTIEAIRSARAATARPLEVVVVDNSVDPAEAERLRGSCEELIVSPANRGYSAAINAGRRRCSGQVMIVSNPDVVFHDDTVDVLAAEIERGSDVAGPRLVWDDRGEWLLPPSDAHAPLELLDAALAGRSGVWREWRDRRRIRKRLRFWSLRNRAQVRALSGAIMAISAAAFDAAGGFDERFTLYFEEDDFLRRVKRVTYVPAAHCRHLYNQSAGMERERAAALFAESERRFLEKWYGRRVAGWLKRLAAEPPPAEVLQISGPIEIDHSDVVVEASPLASFATAAGHFPAGRRVDLPREVWESYRGPALYLRVIDRRTARTLATYVRLK
jgi:GT2 family glycosyltransferase